MNFFLEQGRCRVCGKMFCCSTHQKKHEYEEHVEYSHWLSILPVMCRRCHRKIATIYDLNTRCFQLRKHFFIEGELDGTPRPNRKRKLTVNVSECSFGEKFIDDSTRKVVSASKLKKVFTPPNFYLVDFNGIRITDAAINAVFSPQLSGSFNKLANSIKSSTPLIEEKENIAVIAVSIDRKTDSDYTTPENPSSSLVLVSALKKNSTPFDGIKKNDGRKVTFENSSSPELSVSVYGTPVASVCNLDDEKDSNSCEIMVTVSPVQCVSPIVTEVTADEPENCKITTLTKSVRFGISVIPRSLLNFWDWTQSKLGKRKTVTFHSPVAKRRKWDVSTLRRRPIFSQWVNMNVSSLVRDPLPAYVEKYNVMENDFHDCR